MYVPVIVAAPDTVIGLAGVAAGVVSAYRLPATVLATGSAYADVTVAPLSKNALNGRSPAVLGLPATVTTVPVESAPIPLCANVSWNWTLYVPVIVAAPDTVIGLAGLVAGVVRAYR